jgi:hypothetical protein
VHIFPQTKSPQRQKKLVRLFFRTRKTHRLSQETTGTLSPTWGHKQLDDVTQLISKLWL